MATQIEEKILFEEGADVSCVRCRLSLTFGRGIFGPQAEPHVRLHNCQTERDRKKSAYQRAYNDSLVAYPVSDDGGSLFDYLIKGR